MSIDYVYEEVIDVKPVKHGYWKSTDEHERYVCSVCKKPSFYKWYVCPNCGAKMDDEKKESNNKNTVVRRKMTKGGENIKIKKLEKELGIDFDIFLKAIIKGIWTRRYVKEVIPSERQRCPFKVMLTEGKDGWHFSYSPDSFWDSVALSDYGKTWALTKKEMKENDNENHSDD